MRAAGRSRKGLAYDRVFSVQYFSCDSVGAGTSSERAGESLGVSALGPCQNFSILNTCSILLVNILDSSNLYTAGKRATEEGVDGTLRQYCNQSIPLRIS